MPAVADEQSLNNSSSLNLLSHPAVDLSDEMSLVVRRKSDRLVIAALLYSFLYYLFITFEGHKMLIMLNIVNKM